MNSILFYETAGCSNNSRQKALLVAAGQKLELAYCRYGWLSLRLQRISIKKACHVLWQACLRLIFDRTSVVIAPVSDLISRDGRNLVYAQVSAVKLGFFIQTDTYQHLQHAVNNRATDESNQYASESA